ncbi:hypothetical protein INT45_007552 [Circinella minor]|uniref:Profilin n=1 Tax=Circinella minor TaxID=1195481 RepID=A0A8H7S3P0_9FUNG|nr:hypothetical protein INT45_007552 [Circinella minor]
MSWQQYVDENLIGTGNVSQAGIFGLKDGSPWATSPSFEVKSSDIKKIIAGFHDQGISLHMSGIHVAGVMYSVIKADNLSIYGKKGTSGVCIAKTEQCLVIGVYKEGIEIGNCAKTVEQMADFLRQKNY